MDVYWKREKYRQKTNETYVVFLVIYLRYLFKEEEEEDSVVVHLETV